MKLSKASLDITKEIINQIYLFHSIFNDYIQNEESIFLDEGLPGNLETKMKPIIDNILHLDSQLEKQSNFIEFYSNHYKNNIIEWTYSEKNIQDLLPISIHTFIKKIEFNQKRYDKFYFAFHKICSNFDSKIIEQMFQSNNGVIVWKIIVLVFILINPNNEISINMRKAISYSIPQEIYSLQKGIKFAILDPKTSTLKRFNFDTIFVKPFLTSFTLLSCFKKILKDALNFHGKELKIKKKTLKIMIEEYLNQDLIIVVREFPQNGITLADSSIILLINKDADYPSLASVLMTLYHEMTLLLYRKISNTSFFQKSFDETQDAGKKVEQLLLGNYNTCHRESCYYILDINNYNNSPNTFLTELSVIEKKYEIGQMKDDVSYQLYQNDSTPPSCLLTK